MDTCGRRTRKPPAGALSKEVRSSKTQTQQYKKAFFASRGFPAYRHAAGMMHTSLPRLTLHRIFPIHTALPHTRRSDTRAVMRVMPTLPCVGYCLHGLRIAFWHSPPTVSSCAGCLSGAISIPTSDTPDTTPLHSRYAHATFPMLAS